jgi:hypothetical protein
MAPYLLTLILAALSGPQTASWIDLLNGKDLDGWEVEGQGVWTLLDDGVLVGQCDPARPCTAQTWLYTKKEFDQFDLSLDYWLRLGANSGVSIGDRLRAKYAVDPKSGGPTPARSAYEVNIDNGIGSGYDITGSIYTFVQAQAGVQRDTGWNTLLIEVRKNLIRVTLNGRVVAEHPGVPERPKAGPVGLQLHSPTDVVMFRHLRIREVHP